MRIPMPQKSNLVLALFVAAAMAFGVQTAVGADRGPVKENLCPGELPWNGPCGAGCNQSCIDAGYPDGGACNTYNHPTQGPIPCCQCLQ